MFFDQIGELQQQRLPFVGLEFAPRAFESSSSGGDCTVDVLGIAFGDGRQQIAGRWVANPSPGRRSRVWVLEANSNTVPTVH
jgi:hypothetical protein